MAKKRNLRKKPVEKNTAPKNKVPISNNINSEAIAAALSSTNLPVLLKLCRLCETKDGPFLNIFDIDKIIAKKIEDVMPFVVAENDDLPHKICFRCSAKVEELHEFIQKCVKTQINLRRAIGNETPLPTKVRHRTLWEEKLNESNISNDDLCDALIKKAMESIKEPIKSAPQPETSTSKKESERRLLREPVKNVKDTIKDCGKETNARSSSARLEKRESRYDESCVDDSDIPLKRLKTQLKQNDQSKSKGSNDMSLNEKIKKAFNLEKTSTTDEQELPNIKKTKIKVEKTTPKLEKKAPKQEISNNIPEEKVNKNESDSLKTNTFSLDTSTKPEDAKEFNILDHISMIKVNSVGVLYQCKLCNRNFLKKDVIMSHGCAKSGGIKNADFPKDPPKPEPPKMPTVKYINTKINNESKKPITVSEPINLDDDDDEDDKPLKKTQTTKPRIGPASKVKKSFEPDPPSPKPEEPKLPQTPVVQFPNAPSINSRYKLVPGPNNTFTLVEDGSENSNNATQNPGTPPAPSAPEILKTKHQLKTKASRKANIEPHIPQAQASNQPYPVGLFQTVAHKSNTSPLDLIQPPLFTTPAMKKQSYTIVQTGNPNKLLISTKSHEPEEVPQKKKPRKSKHEANVEETIPSKEPFSVTLEDAAPPQDSGFFTFINVDPLLQPSYVLPTDNIIQESQISTTNSVQKSSAPDSKKESKYTCNMCNESFTREKKLLAHIQSHYNQMDQEDEMRNAKKKLRKKQ